MTKILLCPVLETDLKILFEQQLDREAVAMSAYPPKDSGEFMRHWEGILKNKAIIARTILYKDKLAGHIICWKEGKYEQRVGYWIGKQFWGRGIATSALQEFLAQVKIRPLIPTRLWVKNPGPVEVSRIAAHTTSITGKATSNIAPAITTSPRRLSRALAGSCNSVKPDDKANQPELR